ATSRLACALAEDGDSVPSLLRLMEHHVRAGSVGPQADETIRRLRRHAPGLAEVHAAAASRLRARGLFIEGSRVLRAFVEAHPNDAAGWLACARGALALGTMAESVHAVGRAAALDPDSAEIGGEVLRITAVAESGALPALVDTMVARFPDHWLITSAAALALAASGGHCTRALTLSVHALDLEPELPLS